MLHRRQAGALPRRRRFRCSPARGCRVTQAGVADDTICGMRRTTLYLPDELKAALERTAAQGTSEAEVVRNALLAATIDQAFPKSRIPLFDSGNATLAERVDEELAAGFG